MLGSDQTTIMLIADQSLFREGLYELLSRREGFRIVSAMSHGREAVQAVADAKPDLIVICIDDPAQTYGLLRALVQASAKSVVVALGVETNFQVVQQLVQAGITAYLLKSATGSELVAAIRICLESVGRVFLALPRAAVLTPGQEPASEMLTDREREVLQLTAAALSNAQIGTALGLTEATVKRHLRSIFAKLNAVSRLDAVNKGLAAGIIQARDPMQADQPTPANPAGGGGSAGERLSA